MAIYFNPNVRNFREVDVYKEAHERIGALYGRAVSLLRNHQEEGIEFGEVFRRLGVEREDRFAFATLTRMVKEISLSHVELRPHGDSGTYFVCKGEDPIAVFKIGRKRASIELLVRHVAFRVGLERIAIPGIFCALKNPTFLEEGEETVEELWSGNDKIFAGSGIDEDYFVVGILEPFVHEERVEVANARLDFARLVLFSLIIGLRDGKKDGIRRGTIFGEPVCMLVDSEECFPPRVEPEGFKGDVRPVIAATNLPFLADPLAEEKLTTEEARELWNVFRNLSESCLGEDFGRISVMYADSAVDETEMGRLKDGEEAETVDEGGCRVIVAGVAKVVFPEEEDSCGRLDKDRVLQRRQLDAFYTRMTRLRDFLGSHLSGEFSASDMVFAVDDICKMQFELLRSLHSPSVDRAGGSPFCVIGQFSPEQIERSDQRRK